MGQIMNRESFKQRVKRGDLLLGTIMTLASTEIAEIFLLSGFDWLFVDLEHSTLSVKDAQRIVQTIAPQMPCCVRVPSNDEFWIKKALDIGPSGIIVPQVKTAADAEQAVRFCKYPPDGIRSVGIARAQGYGETFKTYVESANQQIAVILQIEHIDAVDEIATILSVPGIDCIFVGPYDLSGSMGKIGHIGDSDVQDAISTVRKHTTQTGVSLGIFGADSEAVRPFIEAGYNLIAVGMDTMLIGKAAKEITGFFKR
jgi:2-dehydro-3-deoxyglucarate aldolase/4-hydroxy-2-oxoheptanedioate aldolase